MAHYDNSYSRLVAWLKILLPLLALAILSTLFLVARTIDPAQTIPYAQVDIERLTREQRIGKPQYTAVTRDGAAVSLSAAAARPENGDTGRIAGEDVAAGIDLPGGGRVEINAARITLDSAAALASIHGGVVLTSSAGYVLRTDALAVSLDDTRVIAEGAVLAEAPAGRLSADGFELIGDGSAAAPYELVFKGRVKLVYDPNG